MSDRFDCDVRELLVLAAALAAALAKNKTESQIGRMSAFFTLVGDTLAMLALRPGLLERSGPADGPDECWPRKAPGARMDLDRQQEK